MNNNKQVNITQINAVVNNHINYINVIKVGYKPFEILFVFCCYGKKMLRSKVSLVLLVNKIKYSWVKTGGPVTVEYNIWFLYGFVMGKYV